jgi:uncharacterized repeat protein (TIGR04076 family)
MAKVKITVMKKLNYKEVLGPNPQVTFTGAPECDRLEVGQEFISDEGRFPNGFCAWAFADIQRDITHLRLGGDYPWTREKGTVVSCCTDGFRPVIFKLERMAE